MKTYRTKAGETWDMIAHEVYGSESGISLLMGNNQEYLGYFIFPEGVILQIADIPKSEESTLPEWRRSL